MPPGAALASARIIDQIIQGGVIASAIVALSIRG
jgi:hypothetical protein